MKEPFNTHYENEVEVWRRLELLQHFEIKPVNNPNYTNYLPIA